MEKQNQKSKGQENDHVHDKNKKFDHESSSRTDEDESRCVSCVNLCPFCLKFKFQRLAEESPFCCVVFIAFGLSSPLLFF
jgi:hypothetical protein